ncbi:long-chain fatty acid transport protein 2 isoform X1 [Nerophis lumbriciformis]|uniref:long-chain fatty acid transport protein 2 isoform X1 n=1 Tax=Nerophis lumbriciformis TaxID=546530 RepID=UPI002ADFD9D1|nr:long-chain fatty acid transport protein 2-like isoform X1 [Nerophis lumbriciformis]XP_061825738.1 long-chain fatty acid transport protein 2-like isoform X1 [Nerophis lumbriciformis]
MLVWLTAAGGLLLLCGPILTSVFPYLLEDCVYMLRCLRLAVTMLRYKRGKPLHSIVDGFLDAVRKHPAKTFLHFEGHAWTYSDVDRRSNKVARALQEAAQLKEGQAAALFLPNEPNLVWTWLGLAKLGCPVALLNFNIRSKSLLHCFSCCGAKVLITCAELQDAVEEILPALREQGVSVYFLSETRHVDGVQVLTDKISKASDQPLSKDLRANVKIRSTALYIYTSGTTGLPKAAVVTHERMWAASFIQATCGITSDDVIYINLPLYHSSGFLIGLAGAIQRGITVVLKRKFSASQFWDDCREHNVTVMQYIGETMRYLCNSPQKDDDRDHKVRIAIGNGVRKDVWSEFLRRFGDIKVKELYAATEGNIGFINYTSKVGAVGRMNVLHSLIFPYTLIKFDIEKEEPVRNSQGLCIKAAIGETGLLTGKVTQRSPFVGYAGNDQQTEKKRLRNVMKKGDLYFNTGDLMRFDKDNFVYFQDRVGDTFRWKGENVATSEVADILTMAPCVLEANVYGVKVEGNEGRVGMAAVTLKEGQDFDCDDAYKVLHTHLPSYARPRFIRIQPCLEITGTFKMKKNRLVNDGFNPALIREPLYYLHASKLTFVPMTTEIYRAITSGTIKL